VPSCNSKTRICRRCLLELHDQIRSANVVERQLDHPRFLAFQLHADFAVRNALQPPFEELRFADRLDRRNLRQPPAKRWKSAALVSPRSIPGELISRTYPGPGTSSSTSSITLSCLLTFSQSAWLTLGYGLLASPTAARRLTRRRCGALPYVRPGISAAHHWYAIDVHPKKALLADFPLDINDFHAFRTRHPLGGSRTFSRFN